MEALHECETKVIEDMSRQVRTGLDTASFSTDMPLQMIWIFNDNFQHKYNCFELINIVGYEGPDKNTKNEKLLYIRY